MMRLLKLFLILVICTSCRKTDANRESHQFGDSTISQEVADSHHPIEDTITVLKNIATCDSIISLEKDSNKLFILYQQKINLLSGIGKIKEAYYEQGIAVSLLPKDDVRQLEHEAIGAYLQNDMDRYSQLLYKAIDICKKYPRNAAMTLNMATYYILLGDDKSSKIVMKDFLKHENDRAITEAYNDYSFYKKQILDARSILMDALK